jgi:hypothetical protein
MCASKMFGRDIAIALEVDIKIRDYPRFVN